jgi:hypothetical protein
MAAAKKLYLALDLVVIMNELLKLGLWNFGYIWIRVTSLNYLCSLNFVLS